MVNDDTRLEVIKALSYGVNMETIANMAETSVEEIKDIAGRYGKDIVNRKKECGGDYA